MIFDLDGVLVDSIACLERLMRRWAARHRLNAAAVLSLAHGRRTAETIRLVAPHLDAKAEATTGMVVLGAIGTHAAHQLRQVHAVIEQLANLHVETLPVHADARLRVHLHPVS